METKLSRFCKGIMEACWVAAVILIPQFFNVYSSRIFEPDKITILRSLALIVLACWLVQWYENRRTNHLKWSINIISELKTTPLLLPLALLVVVYLIATIASVTPATSLWGSYQRLQGTYTTFSYLVIFLSLIYNLSQQKQVDRLVTLMILVSLPVTIYGLLQKYKIDPIPWGGDVSARIASNMGNSIFVAAYLIMVFPLTLSRIVQSFQELLEDDNQVLVKFTKSTIYIFILILQVIAIYFTGSRGPSLGWLAGLFLFTLLALLLYERRWMVNALVVLAILAAAFLLVFNLSNSPFEKLKELPGVGRFGQLLDPQSNNALVRTYIWRGVSRLVAPHQPLTFPDGSHDTLNSVRPIIGYGPESMYVAYNPFYPPELTQVERRNASPDRSHNETWDSLEITGILGLFVYLFLFLSVFYYGLKWLGFIETQKKRILFFSLTVLGGAISSVYFVIWRGLEYFGVGLPIGIILGLVAYVIYAAIWGESAFQSDHKDHNRNLLMISILAVMLSHFVEINFGIAIVATRLYFWVLAAGLVFMGTKTVPNSAFQEPAAVDNRRVEIIRNRDKKRRKAVSNRVSSRFNHESPGWISYALESGLITALILWIFGYDFLTASQMGSTPGKIIINSLTQLRGNPPTTSYGILLLVLTVFTITSLLLSSEVQTNQLSKAWLRYLGVTSGAGILIGGLFWLIHSSTLSAIVASQASDVAGILTRVNQYQGMLAQFYVFIGLFLLLEGGLQYNFQNSVHGRTYESWLSATGALVLFIIAGVLVVRTNLRVIQADIAFKLAEPFAKEGTWPISVKIYQDALELAPSEDYYYLFLGRAYLEEAKAIDNVSQRDELFQRAEKDLVAAQKINPLNTDHTANLARLNSLWSVYATNESTRKELMKKSSDYFSMAVTLSPNSARLWDEWAVLSMNSDDNPGVAQKYLSRAFELDPKFDWTDFLLAEYYAKQITDTLSENEKNELIQKSLFYYGEALDLATDQASRINYLLAKAQFAINNQQTTPAIEALEELVSIEPNDAQTWRYHQTLAQLYYQNNEKNTALEHAMIALNSAPEDQKPNIQQLIAAIQTLP